MPALNYTYKRNDQSKTKSRTLTLTACPKPHRKDIIDVRLYAGNPPTLS